MRESARNILWLPVAAMLAAAASVGGCVSAKRAQADEPAPKVERPGLAPRPDVAAATLEKLRFDLHWDYDLGEPIRGLYMADDDIFAFTDKGNLYAIGLDDGLVRWMFHLGDDLSYPPCVYSYKQDGLDRKDEVFLISKDRLYALDRRAGFLLWKRSLDFSVASPPSASLSHVYLGSWDNRIYAIEKSDRLVDWSYRTGGHVTARPEATEKAVDSVFVASEDGYVYSFNPVQEERKWMYETKGKIQAAPFYFKTYVYVASTDSFFYSLKADRGEVIWRFATGAPISREPVAYTDYEHFVATKGREREYAIYVVSEGNFLYALYHRPDVKKEYVRWKYPRGEQVLAKGQHQVYILAAKTLVAVDDATGETTWTSDIGKEADFFVTNEFDPASPDKKERRLASTVVLGYRNGWVIAIREKSEY